MMKLDGRSKSVAIVLACAAVSSLLFTLNSKAAEPVNSPALPPVSASQPSDEKSAPTKTFNQVLTEYQAASGKLSKILPASAMPDEDKRKDAATRAIPLAHHILDLIEQLNQFKKFDPATIDSLRQNMLCTLYVLNDDATVTKVKDMSASSDKAIQLNGQAVELNSRWMTAGTDKDAALKIVEDVEKLDKANPDSSRLTMLTYTFAQTANEPENKTRLMSLITDVMTDPVAKRMATSIKTQAAAKAKQDAMVDKPYTLAGKSVDGKDFSTEGMKGKVVLIDFWATWCGPCRASLPHVKETYSKYHDQGLEIVGVDNDYDAKSVTDFTAKQDMPWTQLFNEEAAGKHKWNPTSFDNGVYGIPCMFLIDKKGVLRSVTARADMDTLIPKLLAE